jgi:hypothetical protein
MQIHPVVSVRFLRRARRRAGEPEPMAEQPPAAPPRVAWVDWRRDDELPMSTLVAHPTNGQRAVDLGEDVAPAERGWQRVEFRSLVQAVNQLVRRSRNAGRPLPSYVGRQVKKTFQGDVFLGMVVGHDERADAGGQHCIWYEDGDSEWIEEGPLQALLVTSERATRAWAAVDEAALRGRQARRRPARRR